MVPGLEDYFASGCGIVVAPALANTCQRLNTLQAQYLKVLTNITFKEFVLFYKLISGFDKTFHCFDAEFVLFYKLILGFDGDIPLF